MSKPLTSKNEGMFQGPCRHRRRTPRVATGHIPALRVSCGQVLNIVRGMWLLLGPCDDVFTDPQKTRVVRRGRALIRRSVLAPRRPRTCARAVRQPVTKWPRLLKPQSIEAPWTLQLV